VTTVAPAQTKIYPVTATINTKGHLVIGGCDTVALAQQFSTPLYIYDEATLKLMARGFIDAFRSRYQRTQVVYASKAFINVGLARLLAGYGLGFDVVSGGEVAVVRAAGVEPAKLFFHGNNKTPQELHEAVAAGIGHIVVDSFHELDLLDGIAAREERKQNILVRVSPSVDPHTHAHTTTGILDSKFGFPIETGQAAEAVRRAIASKNLELQGLHFHLGSPIFELEPYAEAIGVVLRFASKMREEGLQLRRFSPGGGFAIAYTEADHPPAPEAYAEVIVDAFRQGLSDYDLPDPELIVEPGRAIAGRAGVALYTVGATKEVPGIRTYVAVDGGMGDNIRPAIYGSKYVATVANRAAEAPSTTVTIAGKYCESGDVLIRDAKLAPVQAGDLIAIPASGAYAPSMASNYNLNGRPPIVVVADGNARLIRRRESYADLMIGDVL